MAAGMTEREDDEDVLDISEQTNRPLDDALHQQRVQAWHPILDPVWVIVALFYLGVILVPTGTCSNAVMRDGWMRCAVFMFCLSQRFGSMAELRLFHFSKL